MHTRTQVTPDRLVDLEELMCPGCREAVSSEQPAEEFSHRDGSTLCPDAHGRTSEPVEVTR